MPFVLFLLDFLVLLVWIRLWSRPANEFTFNPFLSGTVRFTDRILAPFAAVTRAPVPAAALALVVLLGLKCVMAVRFRLLVPVMALPFTFEPPAVDVASRALGRPFLFVLASTAAGLVGLWGAYGIMAALASRVRKPGRAQEAFAYYARPFSLLPGWAMPLALLLCGALVAAALAAVGAGPKLFEALPQAIQQMSAHLGGTEPFPFPVPRPEVLTSGTPLARAGADLVMGVVLAAAGFSFLTNGILFLVIGSFLGSLFRNPQWADLMREFLAAIEGRFARRLMTGAFDWSPLVLFVAFLFLNGAVNMGAFVLLGRF